MSCLLTSVAIAIVGLLVYGIFALNAFLESRKVLPHFHESTGDDNIFEWTLLELLLISVLASIPFCINSCKYAIDQTRSRRI